MKDTTKSLLKPWVWLLVLFFVSVQYSYAQSIARQSITSYGSSSTVGDSYFSQTVGQAYNTNSKGETIVLQGFQQSSNFSVEELKNRNPKVLNVEFYPNPAQYSLFLESTEGIADCQIRVSQYDGKIVHTEQLSQLTKHTLNCQSWVNGIYIITITDALNHQKALKVVIDK